MGKNNGYKHWKNYGKGTTMTPFGMYSSSEPKIIPQARLERNLARMTPDQRKEFERQKQAGELREVRNDEHGFRITSDKQEKFDRQFERESAEDRERRGKR